MKPQAVTPLSRQIASRITIWLSSAICGLLIFSIAIFIQWLIYDDWMHDRGPLRLVGSTLAAGLAFAAAMRWQFASRRRKIEILRRFESIKWMNDRIRNSLQAIECVTYAANPHATDSVRAAVDAIEDVLQEVLAESHPALPHPVIERDAAAKSVEFSD